MPGSGKVVLNRYLWSWCILLFACLAMLVVSEICYANTYYVDNLGGNNQQAGGIEKPWRTLAYAMKHLRPGDILKLKSNGPQHPYRENIYPIISGVDGQAIEISGEDAKVRPYLVGSDDWSDKDMGGNVEWKKTVELWEAVNIPKPVSFWVTKTSEWLLSGVEALVKRKRAKSINVISPGEWFYDTGKNSFLYKPMADESIETLHMEGVVRKQAISIYTKHHLVFRDLILALTAGNAVAVAKASNNIELVNLRIRHVSNNAISVGPGGNNIAIRDCDIRNIGNNGIIFGGDPHYHLHDTIISGCEISNVHRNDCITLHKDKDGNDVGANHVIENNVLHDCREQGIDIASGSKIIARGNLTYNNGISGVAVAWGANDVHIDGHVSRNDGKAAAIIIGPSDRVVVSNSLFFNSKYHMARIVNAGIVSFTNNTFVFGPDSKGALIDVVDSIKKISFKRNIVTSVVNAKAVRLLRFFRVAPRDKGIVFDENLWWSPVQNGQQFFVKGDGAYGFKYFRMKYQQEEKGIFADPGIRINKDGDLYIKDVVEHKGYGCDCDYMSAFR